MLQYNRFNKTAVSFKSSSFFTGLYFLIFFLYRLIIKHLCVNRRIERYGLRIHLCHTLLQHHRDFKIHVHIRFIDTFENFIDTFENNVDMIWLICVFPWMLSSAQLICGGYSWIFRSHITFFRQTYNLTRLTFLLISDLS